MEEVETLLLQLYGAVSEMPSADYLAYAMDLFRPVLGFDSARITTVDMREEGMLVRGSLLYREPSNMMLDWASIADKDLVLHDALARLDSAITFHTSTRYQGREYAIMRDYAERYEHRNGIVQILRDPGTSYLNGVALYRARDDAQFSEAERQRAQRAIPHLLEAVRLNRLLGEQPLSAERQGRMAIAAQNGRLHYCGPAFESMMQLEWPDWRPPRLPRTLVDGLSAGATQRFQGRHSIFCSTLVGERLFVRVRRHSQLELLAPREREVARLYGRGQTYKEIARELGLAPATVRNTLQHVYQKLAIGSKTQLAGVIAAAGA